ncbi:MAG: type IV pilin N-terminal domain-containing protein [Euryarchaeota archaeon]|nr:type IV pilin N-terminal domain-containing protein [Euryarchaeota archaeon]
MEGKKHRALAKDCRAVSEVIGQVLMLAVVVLAFSSIAVMVFSDEGAVKPPHVPRTDLQENIDNDKVKIFHIGGETIDLEDIKIILSVDGTQYEFDISDSNFDAYGPKGNKLPKNGVFTLGDYIEIKKNIEPGDVVDFYFVHTKSRQVIQKTKLWSGGTEFPGDDPGTPGDDPGTPGDDPGTPGDDPGTGEGTELPEWITPGTFPYGAAYNYYQWMDTDLVDKFNDGLATKTYLPQKQWVYEVFIFSIDSKQLNIPESTSFSKVLLKFVYKKSDNSVNMKLNIYNGSHLITINDDLEKCNTFTECVEKGYCDYDITNHVKTTEELENLVVWVWYYSNSVQQSGKTGAVDFVGINLDY